MGLNYSFSSILQFLSESNVPGFGDGERVGDPKGGDTLPQHVVAEGRGELVNRKAYRAVDRISDGRDFDGGAAEADPEEEEPSRSLPISGLKRAYKGAGVSACQLDVSGGSFARGHSGRRWAWWERPEQPLQHAAI